VTEAAYVGLWLRAFALTVAVELAVAVPALGRGAGSMARRLTIVTLAQLATHPLLWFVLPALHLPRAAFLLLGEGGAVLVEAVAYVAALPSCSPRRAVAVSLGANAASVAVGLVTRALTGAV